MHVIYVIEVNIQYMQNLCMRCTSEGCAFDVFYCLFSGSDQIYWKDISRGTWKLLFRCMIPSVKL